MRFGGPVWAKVENVGAWVSAHKRLGYGAAYVPGDLDDDHLEEIALAAGKAGLVLAEVGAWSNPISRKPAERKKAMELCWRRLDQADRIGARCCVNIAGSRGERWDGPDPANLTRETFDIIVQSVREIIDVVKPKRTFYTLEPMPWVFPDSPENYLKLIKAVNRRQFAVHLDVVNMVNCPSRAYFSGDFIRECFKVLGPHIKSCHAKDIRFSQHLTVHLDECRPGEGMLDWQAYLTELNRLDPDTPLMLEHLPTRQEYAKAAAHVRAEAKKAKLTFVL